MNRSILELPLAEMTFVAFDTETTGREPTRARLLEIAAITCRGLEGQDGDQFQQLVKPDTLIPRGATATHGITEEDVCSSPHAGEGLRRFTGWLADLGESVVLVAHNASFDIEVISYESARAGVPVPQLFALDTLTFSRRSLPGLPGYSLEALCRGLSLPTGRFHRALDDARITLDLFRYCAGKSLGAEHRTLAAAIDVIGEPQSFKGAPPLAPQQLEIMETIRTAIGNQHEVELELRKGGGATTTCRVRPFAVYAAPEGALAAAFIDVPGKNDEGVDLLQLERIVGAREVSGGQGLLFG